MKVKNIFANRKSKKKKSNTSDDKFNNVLKTQNFNSSENIDHQNEVKIICDTSEVKLRRDQPSKQPIDRNIRVTSTASTISSNSSQSTKSRPPRSRPWSFIDQFRRQDSKEASDSDERYIENLKRNLTTSNSTPGTAHGSQNNLDVEPTISLKPHGSPASTHSSGISTLPRQARANTVDENEPARNIPSTFNHREAHEAAAYIRELNRRPKSTAGFEFRLFNFFRKTTPSNSPYSNLYNSQAGADSSDPEISSSGRSSFRNKKSKSKKKKNKKRESGGSQRSNASYDSSTMKINETPVQSDVTCVEEKRVPDNGDIVLLESDTPKQQILVNRHTQIDGVTTTSSNDANLERSSSNNSTSSKRGVTINRFPSTSTSSSDRSSCNIRQSRNSVMFEEFVHTYPYTGDTETDSMPAGLHSSVSASNIGNAKRQGILKKASSMDGEAESACAGRSVPGTPCDDAKTEKMMSLDSVVPDLTSNPPTKAELQDIAFPGVMLRRDRNKNKARQRPLSAYATNRPAHVTSLQLDDLPTYSRMRHEMGQFHTESMENILVNQRLETPVIASSVSTNNVRYGNTSLARRVPNGQSYGYSSASVGNFDLLQSYGSKQFLGDMDEDEKLNALLGSTKSHPTISKLSLQQEPSSKRAKTIRKSVVSLANLISPGKPSRGKLQRSSSFKETATTSSSAQNITFKPYRPPGNTPRKAKDRRSQLWCETFDHSGLTEKHIKWQEAIYELYQGERDLVQDLTMANKTYCDSMVTLKMLSDDIVNLIFGKLDCLLPLHEQLVQKLEEARGDDGRTHAVGHIFVEWLPSISLPYREYCANQADAKDALDAAIDADPRVKDFLQRCLESPFSRKLDLWSYLDLPRTRLVKYPLLLKNTLKRTPHDYPDEINNLEKALQTVSEIIEKVDETTGEQQCRYIRSKLEYLDDKQRSQFVDDSKSLLLQGQLKNNRGTKMVVFIFEQAVVLTRSVTRGEKHSFQVYRQPVPMRSLTLDAQSDAEKTGGSFRGGILNSDKLKHAFRLKSDEIGTSYTLQANDEHDRKLWVNAIQEAQTKYRLKYSFSDQSSQGFAQRRRATYDTTLNAHHKKVQLQARRTSSEKGNVSATVREESETVHGLSISSSDDQGLILSSNDEDVGLLWRNRSNTAAPSMMSSPKTKLKSDKEYLNEGARPKKFFNNSSNQPSIVVEGSQGSLFKKSSKGPQRHLSLTGADNWISRQKIKSSKKKESISRSRSLTGSPTTYGSPQTAMGGFSINKLAFFSTASVVSSPGKPPTGRPASPYNLRSSPTLHNSKTAPDLKKTLTGNNKIKSVRGNMVRRSASDVQSRQNYKMYMKTTCYSERNSRANSECDSFNMSNSNNLLLEEVGSGESAFADSSGISSDLNVTVEDLTAGSVENKSSEDPSSFDATLRSMDMCDVTLTECDVTTDQANDRKNDDNQNDKKQDNENMEVLSNNNNIVREDAKKQNVREVNKENDCFTNEDLIEYMADEPKDAKFAEQNLIVECLSPSHGLTKCREEIKVVDEIYNCNLQTSI